MPLPSLLALVVLPGTGKKKLVSAGELEALKGFAVVILGVWLLHSHLARGADGGVTGHGLDDVCNLGSHQHPLG